MNLIDKILAHYKEQTIELRYGEKVGLIKNQTIVLKNDQIFANDFKITSRNDEYVDFFLGKYKILNEIQITLFDKIVNFGSLKQTKYYELNPQRFDHVLKLMRNLKGFESDKDQLKLLINHHLKRSQLLKNKHYAFQKLHHFYTQTENYFKRILDKLDK